MKKSDFSFQKAFSIVGKVFSMALFLVLSVAALFLLYYFIATKIYAAKGPGYEPKYSIYTIASPSMTPTIKVYDAIINVRVKNANEIKVGDVITFVSTSLYSPGMTITHRVVAITEDTSGEVCYRTKGDFNAVEDQACAKYSNIIGKVVLKIPQVGRIQKLLATKGGWLIFILVPALFIISKDIIKLTKLSEIKATAAKISIDKNDPKKRKIEERRKEEIKRKLKLEEVREYYKDPDIKEIEKKSQKKSTPKKRKGKSK